MIKKQVGNRIRQLRKEQNLSQQKLANLCRLDRTYITGVELGMRNISIVNLEKIAVALKVNLIKLFDFNKYEPTKLKRYTFEGDFINYSEAYNKLSNLEDLEEELEIDLITLFKALKQGIYYKSFSGDIDYISNGVLTISCNFGFDIWVEGHKRFDGLLINLKDYGKTWALTKEELENDK